MKFVIASGFFAGLGFAVRLQNEGHEVLLAHGDPDDRRGAARYDLVGNGLVPRRPLRDVITQRGKFRDWIFVWDENHSVESNELLRREGFRVLGGGAWADRMEHDRDACARFVGRHGLTPPASYAFDDAGAAIRFLDDHRDAAFLFKPDRGETHETWMPVSPDADGAREELRQHLKTLQHAGSFLLQERRAGVETNVEVWFVRGEPVFAFMTLEAKRKLTGDLGDFCGCAFDFTFPVPLESRAVEVTVGHLYPAYREMGYTGFGDANVIIDGDQVWFLEKCERFGYNAHPNLFWNLNRDGLGETFAALVDGALRPDFSSGFGASCSLYMDHPAPGKAIQFPPRIERDLYFMDVYRNGDALLTAGYNESVVLANGRGDSIATAWDACMRCAWDVKFAGRSFRVDGADTNYPSSPERRYRALRDLGYI